MRFKNLTADRLEALVQEGFAETNDRQNDSPTLGEFLAFMKQWPEIKAIGYAVSLARDDARVTVEGLKGKPRTKALRAAFRKAFHHASEFRVTPDLYAWWD